MLHDDQTRDNFLSALRPLILGTRPRLRVATHDEYVATSRDRGGVQQSQLSGTHQHVSSRRRDLKHISRVPLKWAVCFSRLILLFFALLRPDCSCRGPSMRCKCALKLACHSCLQSLNRKDSTAQSNSPGSHHLSSHPRQNRSRLSPCSRQARFTPVLNKLCCMSCTHAQMLPALTTGVDNRLCQCLGAHSSRECSAVHQPASANSCCASFQ